MLALAGFAAYAAGLAYVLLNPNSSLPSGGVGWANGVAGDLGAPGWILAEQRFEFLANALVFVPIALLGRWAWPAVPLRLWALLGAGGSLAVEIAQGLFLPERSPTYIDVVANSTGAVLGWLLAEWLSRRRTAGGTPPTSRAPRERRRDPRR